MRVPQTTSRTASAPPSLSLSDKFELSDERGLGFHGLTKSEHVEKSTLKKQHKDVFKTLNEEVEKNDDKPVRPFVLYDLRHTFLTRLGEFGCDVWTLARIAGYSNIKQSSRYVYPRMMPCSVQWSAWEGNQVGTKLGTMRWGEPLC